MSTWHNLHRMKPDKADEYLLRRKAADIAWEMYINSIDMGRTDPTLATQAEILDAEAHAIYNAKENWLVNDEPEFGSKEWFDGIQEIPF